MFSKLNAIHSAVDRHTEHHNTFTASLSGSERNKVMPQSSKTEAVIYIRLLLQTEFRDLARLEQTVPVSAFLLQFNLKRRQIFLYSIRLLLLRRQSFSNVIHLRFKVVRLRLQGQTPHLHLLLALHLLVNDLRNIHN